MSEHTPGPWQTDEEINARDDFKAGPNIGSVFAGEKYGERGICVFAPEVSTDARDGISKVALAREGEANARLIAAAPELLEAAREVWDWRGEVFKDPDNIGPESGFGAALLRMSRVIEEVEGVE